MTKDGKLERLFTVRQAAEALTVSPWTVWGMLKRGELLRSKVGGRTVIRESELAKLVRDIEQPKRDAASLRVSS
jgi:excisionase family DNA binding protein